MIISKLYWPFKNNKIYNIEEANFEEDSLCFPSNKNFVGSNLDDSDSSLSEFKKQKFSDWRKKNIKEFLLRLKAKLEIFKKAYSQIKSSRTIDFYNNIGFVDLELSFENGVFKFRVTPLSALIIQIFDEDILTLKRNSDEINDSKPEIDDYKIFTVEFISQIFSSAEAEIKKRLNFWVSKGALKEISLDPNNDENTFYIPNQRFPLNINNFNETNEDYIYEEEILNFEFISLNENKLNLENAVTTILKNSGPKNFEQLLKKLVITLQTNISEIMLKEILGKLTLDQKIFKDGEYFNVLLTSN